MNSIIIGLSDGGEDVILPTVSEEVWEVWETFWKDLLLDDNGCLDIGKVLCELHDYRCMLPEVAKVYMEVTRGRISKPNTSANAVIGEFQEYLQEEIDQAYKEGIDIGRESL